MENKEWKELIDQERCNGVMLATIVTELRVTNQLLQESLQVQKQSQNELVTIVSKGDVAFNMAKVALKIAKVFPGERA